RLARMYAYGAGVEPNIPRAIGWHLLAKAGGINDIGLDRYVARATALERQLAEQRAVAWAHRTGRAFVFAPLITQAAR
ncbi:MAG: hypothetical protein AAFO79_12465, partial [Pseudomonadota bacterium]